MTPIIVLRDAQTEQFGIRWKIELRAPHREPIVLVVRSSRDGRVISDIQQLGATWNAAELPDDVHQLLADRIAEELVRARLATLLSESKGRRAA